MSDKTTTTISDSGEASASAGSCCTPAADCGKSDAISLLAGSLLLRLWLGVRALQSGIEKFATTTQVQRETMADGEPTGLVETVTVKTYQLSAYKGIPDSMLTTFSDQPLIPGFMLPIYNAVLGPALLILGLTVLLGIASRFSLLLMGLVYISLTWGLVMMGGPAGDSGAAYLGIHIVLIVLALQLTRHDSLRVLKKW
jgi:thiosulfate dehydrogenase [quinone] large subunit